MYSTVQNAVYHVDYGHLKSLDLAMESKTFALKETFACLSTHMHSHKDVSLMQFQVNAHAFTPPLSEFGRDVVIISYHERSFGLLVISGARLGLASERISHGWVNGSSSEKVGMRHDFGFQSEFRQLLEFSQ